jgi:Flp pilus assembly protein TadG
MARGRARSLFLIDVSGVTSVEMAFIAPPLLAAIIAILQTGLIFLSNGCLEEAVEKSSRMILTGSIQTQGLTQSQFLTTACANLPSLLSCANLMVDVQTYSNFSGANTSTPVLTYDAQGNITNQWQYNTGGPGDIVVLRLLYLCPVVGGPLNFTLTNARGGKRLLMATAVFKNEPYQ